MATDTRRPRSGTPRVPDAELDVLAELRRLGEAPAAELLRALEGRRPMVHGSMLTLLGRLEARGLVVRRKGDTGKAFLYSATPRAERTVRGLMSRWVDRLFARDRVAFVASLLEGEPPSDDELRRLESMLARHRGAKAARPAVRKAR